MEKVVSIVWKGSDTILAIVEFFHADATLVNSWTVKTSAKFAMDESVDEAACKVVIAGMRLWIVSFHPSILDLAWITATPTNYMLTKAWREYLVSELVKRYYE